MTQKGLRYEIATCNALCASAGADRLLHDERSQLVGGLSVELVWRFHRGDRAGVGKLTASTPLNEQAISDALGSDYRLRSGMKTDKGNIVHYFEALKNNSVALTINGDNGAISRIDVRDADIKTASGVKIGTPFSDLYSKAFGNCQKGSHDNGAVVECQAEGSQHISYAFTGHWSGPDELMPSDDTLKNWKVSKIIWRR